MQGVAGVRCLHSRIPSQCGHWSGVLKLLPHYVKMVNGGRVSEEGTLWVLQIGGHATVCLLPPIGHLNLRRIILGRPWGWSHSPLQQNKLHGFCSSQHHFNSSSCTYKCFYIVKMWHLFCLYYHTPVTVSRYCKYLCIHRVVCVNVYLR